MVTISHKLPFKDYVKDYVQRWGGVQGLQFVTGSGQLVFLATRFPSSLRWLVWGIFVLTKRLGKVHGQPKVVNTK